MLSLFIELGVFFGSGKKSVKVCIVLYLMNKGGEQQPQQGHQPHRSTSNSINQMHKKRNKPTIRTSNPPQAINPSPITHNS